MPHRTPCTESADDRARIFVTRRTPCTESVHDRARRLMPRRTPCIDGADDRARILMPHRTPCTECADDRAHRLHPHRTPCTQSADDRAHRMQTHRTPYMKSAHDRARRLHDPPHSLHRARRRPCGQALHTLHAERYFTPCSHGPFVGGALFRFVPFVVDSSLRFSSDIGTVDIRNWNPHLRTPHRRRHPSFARPTKCRRSENGIIFLRLSPLFLAGS